MATFYGDWGTITRAGTTYKYRVYIIAKITGAPDTYTLEITKAGFQVTSSKPDTVYLEADSDDNGWFELYMNGSLVRKIYLDSYIAYVISKANEQKSAPVFEGSIKKTFSKTHSSQTASVKIAGYVSIELFERGYDYPISYSRSPQKTGTFSVPAKASYIVSYNANGGSGAPGGQTKWYGEDINLQAGKPTRTGYTFRCWNTKQNGTGTNYNPSQKYTANSGMALYAQWTPISVTLSYNANGGSGAPGSQTKVYDTPLKLQTGTPTRTGYTFKGWATTQARANAGTVDYSAGGTYSANSTSNITLWAAWSPNPYAVTYNANGGSGAPTSQTKYHGTNLTLQSGVPVKAGWLFRGWATSEANATARKNSGTAEYQPSGTYTGNEPLNLWAIWHAIYTYSVSAKRVGADKSSTEDTNGEWVMIEVSITSAEASGNPITAITFTDEETTQSVSWHATNDGSDSAITFPYQPTADNIKLYAWYQRTTASERGGRYNLSAKVDDAIKTGDIKATTLQPVFRTMDFSAGGQGVAFGMPATQNGMLINMDLAIKEYSGNIKNIYDVFYPVGSYYETSDADFDPNVAWGGTWELTKGGIVKGEPLITRNEISTSTEITTTGTTGTNILSFQHTSNTGKIWIYGAATIKTNANTSSINIDANGQMAFGRAITNIKDYRRLSAISQRSGMPIGTPFTVALRMASQNANTTASCAPYSTIQLFVMDVPLLMGRCWHRTA